MSKREKKAYIKGVTDVLVGIVFILFWTSFFVYALVK